MYFKYSIGGQLERSGKSRMISRNYLILSYQYHLSSGLLVFVSTCVFVMTYQPHICALTGQSRCILQLSLNFVTDSWGKKSHLPFATRLFHHTRVTTPSPRDSARTASTLLSLHLDDSPRWHALVATEEGPSEAAGLLPATAIARLPDDLTPLLTIPPIEHTILIKLIHGEHRETGDHRETTILPNGIGFATDLEAEVEAHRVVLIPIALPRRPRATLLFAWRGPVE